MECEYDEDLSENGFLRALRQEKDGELLERCIREGWLICVPRVGSFPDGPEVFTRDHFFSHILMPSPELPETHFTRLDGSQVTICKRVVTVLRSGETGSGTAELLTTQVLFEETCYTEDMLKYKVVCLESGLDVGDEEEESSGRGGNRRCSKSSCSSSGGGGAGGVVSVSSLRDCIDLLWTEGSKQLLNSLDLIIKEFLLESPQLHTKPLQDQRERVRTLYTKCLECALKQAKLKERCDSNLHLFRNIQLSVETYMHHNIYRELIKGIITCTAQHDASLNKIIRNLTDLQLSDLDIGKELSECVVRGRMELSKVESYSTVLGKIGCLHKAVCSISVESRPIGADHLLPVFVFLVIKSGLPNWTAHLTYMTDFNFSMNGQFGDRYNFLVTTLQAAVEHVREGCLMCPVEPESEIEDMDTSSTGTTRCPGLASREELSGTDALTSLLALVRSGRYEEVERILKGKEGSEAEPSEDERHIELCHPLCSCDSCEKSLSLMVSPTSPTVHSRDDKGFTILHVAATYGRPRVADLCLSLGADPDITDYKGRTPLHYAASRGHQNVVLLLLHANGSSVARDSEGDTPLHLACSNGHNDCVKALLYFAEHAGAQSLDVNPLNRRGETPLHLASRWGYEPIVKLLLDYGADPSIKNKMKLTPLGYSHNLNISALLTSGSSSCSPLNNIQKYNTENLESPPVAAASKRSLDLSEESPRPTTTEEMKKLDRLLNAIAHGDLALALFYLGSTSSSSTGHHHPLCQCCDARIPDKTSTTSIVNISDPDGITPLHMAAKYYRDKILSELLDRGADPLAKTRSNLSTPLHYASQGGGSSSCAHILLSRASQPQVLLNSKDSTGNTPLHYACLSANLDLATVFLQYKPDLTIRNNRGQTPADLAKHTMSLSLLRLLTNH